MVRLQPVIPQEKRCLGNHSFASINRVRQGRPLAHSPLMVKIRFVPVGDQRSGVHEHFNRGHTLSVCESKGLLSLSKCRTDLASAHEAIGGPSACAVVQSSRERSMPSSTASLWLGC